VKIERELYIHTVNVTAGRGHHDVRMDSYCVPPLETRAQVGAGSVDIDLRGIGDAEAKALALACESRRRIKLTIETDDVDAKVHVRAAREQSRMGNTKAALEHALKAIEMLTGEAK
jgi:hypothetical protein